MDLPRRRKQDVAKRRGAMQSSGVAEAEAEAIGKIMLEAMTQRL